ncbi:MAG: DUF2130 domain-containing protein [Candidatus Moranbacteria bacterium]|nr:DUF2130 domain-containing protein [Candidatus Moranbacteria bacterium]
MTEQSISCPKCATNIPLTEALSQQITEQLRGEFEREEEKRQQAFSEQQKRLEMEKKMLEQKSASMDELVAKEISQKLSVEKEVLWKKAEVQAQERLSVEMADLKSQNEERARELEEARKNEIELRRKTREIEDREKNLELEMERKMDEEKEKLGQSIRKAAEEEFRMKMLEKDKQLEQAQRQADDLKRKLDQGSMQIQGDVQENDLRDTLRSTFLSDIIEDVATGIRGADLIQTVQTQFGQKCGVLLWESKNTKAWSGDWIKKLKSDQGIAKADVCILVSKTLPEGIASFGLMDGVWVCEYASALPLAEALRVTLQEVHKIKQASVGKGEKMEALYEYLTGNQFKNRVENIVMAFTSMKNDLDIEKRSFQKMWSKREKEIERVTLNTVGMYGDLQGIAGANALPRVESLELPEETLDEPPEEIEKIDVPIEAAAIPEAPAKTGKKKESSIKTAEEELSATRIAGALF